MAADSSGATAINLGNSHYEPVAVAVEEESEAPQLQESLYQSSVHMMSIHDSVIEASHPECKFCSYCFKGLDDQRAVVQTKKRMLRKTGETLK